MVSEGVLLMSEVVRKYSKQKKADVAQKDGGCFESRKIKKMQISLAFVLVPSELFSVQILNSFGSQTGSNVLW